VDLQPLLPTSPPADAARVVFCGVMNYTPNVDGVLWFCQHVWPLVRARRPDAELLLVGSDPASAIRRLHAQNGIEVTGTVDDVRPHLWRSAVAIAPLLTARGIQNKVLEAIGAGLPAVVSAQVFEGLPAAVRAACRIGASPERFAEETLRLLSLTPNERRMFAAHADMDELSWQSQLGPLRKLLTDSRQHQAVAV
jgi:glycosyltransferase involved in cell wall biosynthesis